MNSYIRSAVHWFAPGGAPLWLVSSPGPCLIQAPNLLLMELKAVPKGKSKRRLHSPGREDYACGDVSWTRF